MLELRLMDDVQIPQVSATNGPDWHFFGRPRMQNDSYYQGSSYSGSFSYEGASATQTSNSPQLRTRNVNVHVTSSEQAQPEQTPQVIYASYVTKTASGSSTAPGVPQWEAALGQLRSLLAVPALTGQGVAPGPAKLEVIQAGVGSAIHLVPVADVVYFEAADKYVRVITAQREHLIRISLRDLLPQLDGRRFWQIHRGTVVRADAIDVAMRDESGKLTLALRGRPERLTISRLYAHLFKAM